MKQLKEIEHISKEAITIYLLKRIGDKALVANYTDSEQFQGYEVHIIQKQKAKDAVIGGVRVHFEARERYRRCSEFGHYAWHYATLSAVYENHPEFSAYDAHIVDLTQTVEQNSKKTGNTIRRVGA